MESFNCDYSQFQFYFEDKLNKINSAKVKLIKAIQKYFNEIKAKIEKDLAKEQKKIINAYEDSLNSSIYNLKHYYFFNFQRASGVNNKNERKFQNQTSYENQKKSMNLQYNNHNQLTIKIQVKKLIEQMILAESHLNETAKLIGQNLKGQLQRIIAPLGELLIKIPKLSQVKQKSSLLPKQLISANQKTKYKNSTKAQKHLLPGETGNDILSQKNNKKIHQFMKIEKMLMRHAQYQSLNQISHINNIFQRKQTTEKQNAIILLLNKYSKGKTLLDFELVNHKSLLHIYKQQTFQPTIQPNAHFNILEQPDPPEHQNHPVQNHQVGMPHYKYYIYINDQLLCQNQSEFIYQMHSKIQFYSKPDRQYLIVLISKIVLFNQNLREKIYQALIFNYKGELISKELINKLRVKVDEKSVKILQIRTQKDSIYIILSNRINRFCLKQNQKVKTRLFSRDEKITKAVTNKDKIILYQINFQKFYLLNNELILSQLFQWSQIYPHYIQLSNIVNFSLYEETNENIRNDNDRVLINAEENVDKEQKYFGENQGEKNKLLADEVCLIIPKCQIDCFYYFSHCFVHSLRLKYVNDSVVAKDQSATLEHVIAVYEVYNGVYIILSRRFSAVKPKLDLFILEIQHSLQIQNSLESSDPEINFNKNGKLLYLQTVNELVINSKFIKYELYLVLKSGKVIIYSLH